MRPNGGPGFRGSGQAQPGLLDGRWDKHDTKDAANIADLISQGKCLYYDYPEMELRDLRTLLSLKKKLKKQEHGYWWTDCGKSGRPLSGPTTGSGDLPAVSGIWVSAHHPRLWTGRFGQGDRCPGQSLPFSKPEAGAQDGRFGSGRLPERENLGGGDPGYFQKGKADLRYALYH